MIDISSTKLLPQGVDLYGPLSEEQFEKTAITGRVFRLTRMNPKRYVEYYIQPCPDICEEVKK